jgi:hypothetical protein
MTGHRSEARKRSQGNPSAATGRAMSTVFAVAFAASAAAGCAAGIKGRVPGPPLNRPQVMRQDGANPSAVSLDEFRKKVGAARKEIEGIEARAEELRAAKAAITLGAVIAKLHRLEKGFGISSPTAATDAGRALSDLQSGGKADAAMRSAEGLAADAENLRKQHMQTLAERAGSLAEKIIKLRSKPEIFRRLYAPQVRKARKEFDSAMAELDLLKKEEGMSLSSADAEAVKLLDKSVAEALTASAGMRQQLEALREREIEKARREATIQVRRLEVFEANPSPDNGAERVKAMAALKVWLDRIEQLQK